MSGISVMIQNLSWDSQFLGFQVARLEAVAAPVIALDTALTKAREAGYKLLYVVIDPTDSDAAEVMCHAGAWLADRKVTFVMDLPQIGELARADTVINTATEFTPHLESLAWQSGEYSRFRLDPRFAPHVFKDLYSQWLHNSLTGEIARVVLVFRNKDGVEQGLLTLGGKDNRADIGVLAVDESLRGKGVARCLVATAIEQAREWGCHDLQVITQSQNEQACRFYLKCGFHLEQEQHIYHLWID
jgi:dTDP-4-amino-4,6-dideoxy-D-galactose acyltransferase